MTTGQFLTPLRAERAGDHWVLTDGLRFRSGIAGHVVAVPKGFETDFASVPRLPLAHLLAGDTAHAAAVVHDYLYRNRIGTRAQADAVFYEAMIALDEPWWRRWLMWAAVRAGGRATW